MDNPTVDIKSFVSRAKRQRTDGGPADSMGESAMMNLFNPTESSSFVTPGEAIQVEPGFLRGHGTRIEGDLLVATVAGYVERVNKLVSVRALRSRYVPEVGDVLLARITQVQPNQKRWKVDINARQDGTLALSAINLPGGVQRRRTYEDELHMRRFFQEDDIISAEVQSSHHGDSSVAIHTRNLKYGKLTDGQFLAVKPVLIKRMKNHFSTLKCGIHVILGLNGYIWISPTSTTAIPLAHWADGNEDESHADAPAKVVPTTIPHQAREDAARVRNAIESLHRCGLPIYPETIDVTYSQSKQLGLKVRDMLSPEQWVRVTQAAAELAKEQQHSGFDNHDTTSASHDIGVHGFGVP